MKQIRNGSCFNHTCVQGFHRICRTFAFIGGGIGPAQGRNAHLGGSQVLPNAVV